MVLEGIYRGELKPSAAPVSDGIVRGLPAHRESMKAAVEKVKGSATQYSVGVFGAGATPQGVGDAKHGAHKGMAMAQSHPNALKRGRAIMAEVHEAMHNA